jgi:hypothetical protein
MFVPPLLTGWASWLRHFPAQLLVSLLLLAIGIGLFWLREKRRIVYGLMETCFAIVPVHQAVGVAIGNREQWAIVVTALYVLVRGLDNIKTGYTSYPQAGAGSTNEDRN